jgi:N-acyl-D-amino-acid deacylase
MHLRLAERDDYFVERESYFVTTKKQLLQRRCAASFTLMKITRRQCLQASLAAGVLMPNFAFAAEDSPPAEIPAVGETSPAFAPLDRWVQGFMSKHNVPGGQFAITRRGKLVYQRAFGMADRDAQEPVTHASLFRIASISKPITAVAILRLVQAQKLKLDDKVADILKIEPHIAPDTRPDERWANITIAHCLTHTGGWDREKSYDPMFAFDRISKALGTTTIGPHEIIRYMLGQPLDTTPGEKYAYSNFGYCLLGRVIETLSGESYEAFVKRELFSPLGITAPRIGGSLESERAENEVRYYTIPLDKVRPAVGEHAGDREHAVPVQYGGWNHQALDAHGGWIASATDLARFAAAFDRELPAGTRPLLERDIVEQMFSAQTLIRAANPEKNQSELHYGLGWLRWHARDGRLVNSHNGALPCTAAALIKLPDDLNLAVLFNIGQVKPNEFIARTMDGELVAAVKEVDQWPE